MSVVCIPNRSISSQRTAAMASKQTEFSRQFSYVHDMRCQLSEEDWNKAKVLESDNLDLPDSPNCPDLFLLQLQDRDLQSIPSSFFDRMPLLQTLDLSYTSIKSLPESLPRLLSLRGLILRWCKHMIELPPQVGQLQNLEKLDLDNTRILFLPETVAKLSKLKFFRVSFCKYHQEDDHLLKDPIIRPELLSNFPHRLTVLSIDVDQEDTACDGIAVGMILMQISYMKSLTNLTLYLPNMEVLFRRPSLIPYSVTNYTVGHHRSRIISRVPLEVEALFRSFKNCFRLINGEHVSTTKVKHFLERGVTSFFLDKHVSAQSLSDFMTENMKELRFCLVANCNEMQTIIDMKHAPSLPCLDYLIVYYANNLKSIWNPTTNIYQNSLSNLRVLGLHSCDKLSIIFTPVLILSMHSLEELCIEICISVTSIFSSGDDEGSSWTRKPKYQMPNLKRISLLSLPKLVRISEGLLVAPMLEKLAVSHCGELRNLSNIQTQVETLYIKGRATWWNELRWENHKVSKHIHFTEINPEQPLDTQLADEEFIVLEYGKTIKSQRSTRNNFWTLNWLMRNLSS